MKNNNRNSTYEAGKINLVAVFVWALVICGAYAAWHGLPIWWQNNEIRAMMGEVAITAGRNSDANLAEKVRLLMESKFEMEIPREDVHVWRKEDNVFIQVKYTRVVRHVWGNSQTFWFQPRVKRLVL